MRGPLFFLVTGKMSWDWLSKAMQVGQCGSHFLTKKSTCVSNNVGLVKVPGVMRDNADS